MPSPIYLRPLFHPGTSQPITPAELEAMTKQRHETIRKHANHEVTRAIGELLDLQAARSAAEALDPERREDREQKVGECNGISYVASVLRAIIDHKPAEREEESNA